LEVKLQIRASSSSLKLLVEANWTISCQTLPSLSFTVLLNVHFKLWPSHNSAMVLVFSFTMMSKSQNWIARLEVPSELSSQNYIFFPSPTLHLKPILAAFAAYIKPLKNWEHLASLAQKNIWPISLVLNSIRSFQILPLSYWYLLIQEASRQVFRSQTRNT
jgi:hypothetical protein